MYVPIVGPKQKNDTLLEVARLVQLANAIG